MPWCEDCSKFWNPNTIPPDGTCPSCGRVIGDPPSSKVPWHFWVLIVGTVIYLGYRAFQGFALLVENDHTPIAVVIGVLVVGLTAAGLWWWYRKEPDGETPVDEAPGSDPPGREPGSDAPSAPGA